MSSKVAGEVASLTDPALDRILKFAGEVGLVVILHNDIDMPFAKAGAEPVYLTQMKDLLRRHPRTTIIWAHTGLGRVVHPVQPRRARMWPSGVRITSTSCRRCSRIRRSPTSTSTFRGMRSPSTRYRRRRPSIGCRELLNAFPDRFLFGTDNVAPNDQATQMRVYDLWNPIWAKLTPEASRKVRLGHLRAAVRRGSQQGPRVGSGQHQMMNRDHASMNQLRIAVAAALALSPMTAIAVGLLGRGSAQGPGTAPEPAGNATGRA